MKQTLLAALGLAVLSAAAFATEPPTGCEHDRGTTPQPAPVGPEGRPRVEQPQDPPAVAPTPTATAATSANGCPTGTEQEIANKVAALKPFSAATNFMSNQGFLRYCLVYATATPQSPYREAKTATDWRPINNRVMHVLREAERSGVKVSDPTPGSPYAGKTFEQAIKTMNVNHKKALEAQHKQPARAHKISRSPQRSLSSQ